MIRNTYGHKIWTFPGGGINRHETLEAAAERELCEEVGVKINQIEKIGEFITTAEYKRDTVTVFMGEVTDANFKIDQKEILEARWFSLETLPDVSPYAKQVISMLQKENSDK